MASIVFEHVTKRYADGAEAVKDMNLAIADGEFMILVGPSGSGKSTALRMLAGLEDITEGVIRIGDDVVNDLSPRDRDIAMVFQNYALYPHMTVRQNMAFALKLGRGRLARRSRRKVDEAAKVLAIEEHLHRKPGQLSGGQDASRCDGSRDRPRPQGVPDGRAPIQPRCQAEGADANRTVAPSYRLGTTTIYVTHDQVEAVTLGDRIAVMRAGRIQQVGTPTDLYEHPLNLFVAGFIGSPSMNFLPGQLDGDQLRTPIGDLRLAGEMRRRLEAGDGGGRRGVIVGIRPEHFEDASLVTLPAPGHVFETKIEVLEALGSDFYAHFSVDSPRISSSELEELADETNVASSAEDAQVVARLAAASGIKQGQEAQLWVDTSQLHLFDHETGRSLLTSENSRLEVPESSTASRRRLIA